MLRTAFISHPDCLAHDPGEGHPECARRLWAIEDRLIARGLADFLRFHEAPLANEDELLRVHSPDYLRELRSLVPQAGHVRLDQDTVISPESWPAALRASGAVRLATDLVLGGAADSAFCSVRPPGHHAERDRALGFCLFNNIAVGVAHALEAHNLTRVAVLDFDVHQGNGTERMFAQDPRVLFCSTFQHPFYPFTPWLENAANRVNVPLPATARGAEFRAAVTDLWLPALAGFRPQLVFLSAGFDGHRDDDMSYIGLEDDDFRWVSERAMEVARSSASGRIVSVLEGGYEFDSLGRCVEQHLRVLMGLN
jgi:acetoin utilization deacetylase AcuC-like enzyme